MNIKRTLCLLLALLMCAAVSCTAVPTNPDGGDTAPASDTRPAAGTDTPPAPDTLPDTVPDEATATEPAAVPDTEPETEPVTEPETEPETFTVTFPAGEPHDVTEGGSLYAPLDGVVALRADKAYAFRGLVMTREAVPARLTEGRLFADAEALMSLFGLPVTEISDTALTAHRGELTLSFVLRDNSMTVNGDTYAFPTVIREAGHLLIAVDTIAGMLGYDTVQKDGTLYFAPDASQITEEVMNDMNDRYTLYENTVFNTADADYDKPADTRYLPVDPSERMVGVAYTTWFWEGRQWGGSTTWDMPLLGAYTSLDADVIYQHGIWLRDAGVDFVFVDWSNNTCYDPATMAASRIDFRTIEQSTDLLFEVWSQIEGAPKICIFAGPGHSGQENVDNGNHQRKVDQIYRDYVEKYPDMYFCYDGKPLLMCYGATPTQYGANPRWTDDRFTVRWMTGYVGQQGALFNSKTMASPNYWSWEERGLQTFCYDKNRYVEAVTCTAASRAQGEEGQPGYIPAIGRENGETLRRQFQRAIDLGARFAIVVSWNEWTTGEQLSVEVSKDLEPSQIHGTFYLDLLTELIKKFKGVNAQ